MRASLRVFTNAIVLLCAGGATVAVVAAPAAGASRVHSPQRPHTDEPVTDPAYTDWNHKPGHHQPRPITLVADAGQSTTWACSAGSSCYADGRGGTGAHWTASGCGFQNLRLAHPVFTHRITSIWNRGSHEVDLYRWNGTDRWIYLGTVAAGARGDLPSTLDNATDAVDVRC